MLIGLTDKAKWGYAVTQLVEALPYKFTGSIPDEVIRIFLFLNPSGGTGRTAALGSTQSLNRNKYHGCLLEGKADGA
jgi:hypothetical protein